MTPDLVKTHGAVVRDAAAEIIMRSGVIRTIRVVPTFQWQPEDAPACGVYLLRETESANGDFNAGEPSFNRTIVIGVSILVKAQHPGELADATDYPVGVIKRLLLTTPDFIQMFEGVVSFNRTHSFPTNGSSYLCETRLEMEVQDTDIWPPCVEDDFAGVDVRERPAGKSDATPPITFRINQSQ